jgi:SAM-dependent methyltransferase
MSATATQSIPTTDTGHVNTLSVTCRVCGSPSLNDLGPIHHPSPALVAGVPIDLADIEYRLFKCPRCSFQFKNPPIADAALLRCYERAQFSNCEESPDPRKRRFDTLKRLIETHSPGRRILDVGCFNGALLQYLGDSWQRYGVEPSQQAAIVAQQCGITVIGQTINHVPTGTEPFDAILLIDVVEHIADLLPPFAAIRALLKPRGIIVIVTGDTDAWTWRMQKNRYWYCSMPEHVSFFCQRTLWQIASANRLDTLAHMRVSHVRSNPFTFQRQLVMNLGHELVYRCGVARRRSAPGWLTARDHMLHIMRAR